MSGLRIALVGMMAVAAGVTAGVSAGAPQGAVTLRLARAEIQVGETVAADITAAAGAAVTVAITGPSVVAPASATGTGASQALTLGPFTQPGVFTVTASSGAGAARRQATATLQVTWAGGGPAVTGARVGPATARASWPSTHRAPA
jgi:hypothetical protein